MKRSSPTRLAASTTSLSHGPVLLGPVLPGPVLLGPLLLGVLLLGCGSRSDLNQLSSRSDLGPGQTGGSFANNGDPDNVFVSPTGDDTNAGPRAFTPGSSSPTTAGGSETNPPGGASDGSNGNSDQQQTEPENNPTGSDTDSNEGPLMVPCLAEEQGVAAVFERVERALEQEAPEDQAFIRYVVSPTLRTSHCSGTPATEENYSEFTRDALREQFAATKIVNSTSTAPSIYRVQGVPGLPWLLRIDLRELQWEQTLGVNGQTYDDAWEAASSLAAQSLQFAGAAADTLRQLMQTSTPFLLIGDFLATVGQGEMYYALTEAPNNLQQLQLNLGISANDTLDSPAWLRGGFSTSGVSKQYRSVAKYVGEQADSGLIFWRTLDFEPDTNFSSIYEDPLGSGSDVKQAIYNLPNGLPGYFLADSQGNRILEVPPSIDINPAQNAGVSGIGAACASCHNGGLIPFVDAVQQYVEEREGTRFSTETVNRVREIYRPRAESNQRLQEDSTRLVDAVSATGIPAETPDPLSRVVLQHELGTLRRPQAASELFVTSETLVEQSSVLPAALRIATETRALNRNQFVEIYRQSLCVLQAGKPLQIADCP